MRCHELSSQKVRLLLSVLMLIDACRNHYAIPSVDPIVSHESRYFADEGHKALLDQLPHLLRVSHALVSAHCNVHSFSPPPKKEGGTLRPRLKLFNVFSVKGYKGWRNFGECPFHAARRRLPEADPIGGC